MTLVIILAVCVGFLLGTTTICGVLLYLEKQSAFERKLDDIDALVDAWNDFDLPDREFIDELLKTLDRL